MMLKPSVDKLLDRIHSKYSLVILSSKRAHELEDGEEGVLSSYDSVKNVGRALEEIEAGELLIHPCPEAKRERMELEAESKKRSKQGEPAPAAQFDFLSQKIDE